MTDMVQPVPQPPVPGVDDRAARPAVAATAVVLDDSWAAGRKLSEARIQLGLSLEQVAERTKVRSDYLEALEAMNTKLLPGRAYAIAYLRSYARALGLDEDAIVDQYQAESALSREDARPQIRTPDSRPARERPWLAAAMLGLVAGGFVAWRAVEPSPRPAADELRVAVDGAGPWLGFDAPSSAMAAALRTLEVRAVTPARLEVRGADGTVFFYGELQAGQAYRPDPAPDWTLHARDGSAFELLINGRVVGPLGEPGQPVLGRRVDSIPIPPETAIAAIYGPQR
jgi:cytoskeleton protein RodZ